VYHQFHIINYYAGGRTGAFDTKNPTDNMVPLAAKQEGCNWVEAYVSELQWKGFVVRVRNERFYYCFALVLVCGVDSPVLPAHSQLSCSCHGTQHVLWQKCASFLPPS